MSISDQNLEILSSGKKCHQLIRDHLISHTVCVSKGLHKTGFIHLWRYFAVSQMLLNVTYSLLYFKLLFLNTQIFFSLMDSTTVLWNKVNWQSDLITCHCTSFLPHTAPFTNESVFFGAQVTIQIDYKHSINYERSIPFSHLHISTPKCNIRFITFDWIQV